MEPHHETGFPATLCQWVGEIVQSSPEAARLTLVELIVGALLASGGHVTQAILALTPRLGWQAYHWMLEHGRFRLLDLISALCRIVRREIGERRCFAIIDDTLAPRCSVDAPGVAVRFDHAAKTNRPTFLRCQCFVTLSAVVPCRDRPRSVPLVTGLCRSSGNAGKIALAKGLLRAVGALGPLCLLLDAWSMRGSLIRTALRLGHEVIGQATPPCSRCPRRGSPQGAAGSMALASMSMRLRRGPAAPCRVPPTLPQGRHRPWCELQKGSGWAKARLLLSTDPTLSAPVEAYSGRWTIEPLFRDLKTVDGLGAMWQRGRIALLRWLHLVQIARTLLVLLTARAEPHALIRLGGWRPAATLTLVKDALAARFRNFEAFRLLPETCRKSGPARHTGPPAIAAAA